MDDNFELAELTIDQLLQRWPETMRVIRRLRLACLGCAIAPFCTVAEAAVLHGLDQQAFLEILQEAIREIENKDTNTK